MYTVFVPEYFDRLTMPKLVISASGDEFFPPDDTHLFYDAYEGQTHFLYGFFCVCQLCLLFFKKEKSTIARNQ